MVSLFCSLFPEAAIQLHGIHNDKGTLLFFSAFPVSQFLSEHLVLRCYKLQYSRCVCHLEDQRAPTASITPNTTRQNRQDPAPSISAKMNQKLGAKRKPSAHHIPIFARRSHRRKPRQCPAPARSLEAASGTSRRVRSVPPEVATSLKAVLQHQTRLLRARALRVQQKQLRWQLERLCLVQDFPRPLRQLQQKTQR